MSATTIAPSQIPTGTYTVDPKHSNIGFAVRHMGIATVRGSFEKIRGTIDATGETPVLEGVVDVASITTGDEQRDAHLTAPDFFDVQQHPEIRFHSTAAEATDESQMRLVGQITIKGVSKPIELTGTIAAGGADPWGHERIGLELEADIDRREFDLSWNQTLPGGGLLVANEVKLLLSVSAVKD
jgi:polyisoprenoid-binding protein YceI